MSGRLGRAVSTNCDLICDILRLPGVALGTRKANGAAGIHQIRCWFSHHMAARVARAAGWEDTKDWMPVTSPGHQLAAEFLVPDIRLRANADFELSLHSCNIMASCRLRESRSPRKSEGQRLLPSAGT
jgi:hypothetical protein